MHNSPTETPKQCLVTGGAGFIGSHLVERLIHDGHDVAVVDNFSTGRETNLAGVAQSGRLRVQRVDVRDPDAVRACFERIDWVFHLAALADIVPSVDRPLDYHAVNVDGTVNVLEAARKADVDRFVNVASSTCYGIPDDFPTPETAPIRPMYPYALTKWMGERYVDFWHQLYGLPTVTLRCFNVFGPRARTTGAYGAVFGVFLAQKLAGKPFTVVGDGEQTRDFTYVTDIADALVSAAESSVAGETFNVGSGGTYSINRLAELLGGGPVIHLPRRPGEPDATFGDIRKIRRVLGWQPQVRFEDGVGRMLEHIEDWRGAPVWDSESIGKATRNWFEHLGKLVVETRRT